MQLIHRLLIAATLCCGFLSSAAQAVEPYDWKLTLGEYIYSDHSGTDANLRWRANGSSAWLGVYGDSQVGSQVRTGADTSWQAAKYLQVQPSVQLASGGFMGGSLNLELGAAWYAIVGVGRTDSRPYYNLNFDPNDAMTYGLGHSGANGLNYALLLIEDNRFHTGQRDWHANIQIPYGASHATMDLMHKTGLSESGRVSAWGGVFNYDWPRWFARLAYDPYQNFSAQSAWRLAAGLRF